MPDPKLLTYSLRRRRFLALAAVAAGAAFSGALAKATLAAPPVRKVLPNGLVVIVEERRSANTVALHLAARAGARDDADLPGLTTLTSRLMFQGTGRRPSETDLQRAVAEVGGTLTRGTTAELSFFASVVPTAEVDIAFDLLSDLVLDPLFTAEALLRQQRIALLEQAQRRADPSLFLAALFQTALFAGHPLSIPPLGTPESLEALTRDALLANRQRLWGAANLALAVVGRIRPEDALAKAEQYFGSLPQGTANQRPIIPLSPPDTVQVVRGEVGQQQVQFRFGFPAPGLLEPDRYPMTVLDGLTGGPGGRFFRELRSVRGLAYVADSAYVGFTDAGAWFIEAGVDPPNLDLALAVVHAEIQRLRDAPPETGEVTDKISEIAGRQVLAEETNAARASRLASRELLGIETTEEFVHRIREVTPTAIQSVAQTYLDPQRALLAIVGPPNS